MHIHADFEEFLKFLNEESVEFVIIGGYAVAFHGYVRTTGDMDLFFRATGKNISRIRKALKKFGLQITAKQVKEFSDPGNIIRLGIPPVRLELLNNISGLTFGDVWKRRIPGEYGTVAVNFISRDDLLKNKKASGRPKDLADYDELGGNRN